MSGVTAEAGRILLKRNSDPVQIILVQIIRKNKKIQKSEKSLPAAESGCRRSGGFFGKKERHTHSLGHIRDSRKATPVFCRKKKSEENPKETCRK